MRFVRILECSEMKVPVQTRIAFAGRHGIILLWATWATCDETCVSIVPLHDLTVMSERGVNVQSVDYKQVD